MRDSTVLYGLLAEQLRLHRAVIELLEQQTKQIALLRLGKLDECTREENRLASEIQEVERHRHQEMMHWADDLGVDEAKLTLRHIVSALSRIPERVDEARKLWKLGEELQQVIDEIRKRNDMNRLILSRGLEFLEEKFTAITSEQSVGGYTLHGTKNSKSKVPRVVNVRA